MVPGHLIFIFVKLLSLSVPNSLARSLSVSNTRIDDIMLMEMGLDNSITLLSVVHNLINNKYTCCLIFKYYVYVNRG